jgi:CHAT domain-containing protein
LIVPGSSPHYWIDDVEVENASSLQLLTRASERQSIKSDSLLLIGAPVPTGGYPALTHAAEEMERVASHFPANHVTRISGPAATPSAYRGSRPGQFDVIHFVAHGIASETSPLESAIILSPQGVNPYKLYARNIISTPLRADLVTISACSGAGTRDYSGEGLVGLAWGFLRAGAHHVVAGLWDVDDAVEPDLMDHFYDELRNTKSPATALRLAKLAMLHSDSVYRKPYYWASLQLYTGS